MRWHTPHVNNELPNFPPFEPSSKRREASIFQISVLCDWSLSPFSQASQNTAFLRVASGRFQRFPMGVSPKVWDSCINGWLDRNASVRVHMCEQKHVFEGATSLICMSGANIFHHHQGAGKQSAGRCRRRCQERGNAHAFESLQLPNCFTSGENTQHMHAHTDVSCFLWFPLASLFFALVVFSHHSSCPTQTLYVKPLHFLFSYNKIFVILFTCCDALSGTAHFCHPEGIHWTVLMEGGSWNGTAW